MGNLFHMNDFVAASQGDAQNMLGKFLYFSLSNLLVEKAQLSELCESMGISYSGGTRLSVAEPGTAEPPVWAPGFLRMI